MTPFHFHASPSSVFPTRRDFFRRTGGGFSMVALTALLESNEFVYID